MVDTDEITVTMKITAAKQVQYALLAVDGTAVPLGSPTRCQGNLDRRAPGPVRPRRHQKGCCLHQAAEHYILAGLLAAEHRRCPRQKESKLAMASVTIRLNSIGEVKEFNRIAATVPEMWTCIPGATAWMQNPSWVFCPEPGARTDGGQPNPERGRTAQKVCGLLAG